MKYYIVLFFIFIQIAAFSQVNEDFNRSNSTSGVNENQNNTGESEDGNKDEVLISGRLSGDTIESHINTWIFKDRLLYNEPFDIDTSHINFHNYDKLYQNNASSARIGNIGLASRSNEFFKSLNRSEYIFLSPYKDYLMTNENTPFFSTNLPYTTIKHAASTKQVDEQSLDLLHTQNISPNFNVGFNYKVINAKGQMTNNKGNINSGAFWTSYLGTRYNIQANFVLNKIQNQENGGIKEIDYIPGADLDPVSLSDAKVKILNYGLMIHQKYKLGITKIKKRIPEIKTDSLSFLEESAEKDTVIYDTIFIPFMSLNHTLKYKKSHRVYYDSDNPMNDFYPSYIDSINTMDSTAFRRFENTFQVQFNENQQAKFKFRARAYIRNELLQYSQVVPSKYYEDKAYDSLATESSSISNTSIGGALFDYSSDKWKWNFEGELFIQGRKSADVLFTGDLERIFTTAKDTFKIRLSADYENATPSYYYEYFNSNHYNWHNQFNKESKLFGNFEFEYPRFMIKTKLQVASIDNFIYFGSEEMPVQTNENINVIAATINKNIKFGAFYWNNSLVYQLFSDRKIIQMPEIIYNTQLYSDFFISEKALRLQTGIEMQFTNEYSIPGYSPALGQFYQYGGTSQIPTSVGSTNSISSFIPSIGGNYPLVSAFINFKVKKVLAFVSVRNITNFINPNYQYTTHLYPVEGRTFHWGVFWRFYD